MELPKMEVVNVKINLGIPSFDHRDSKPEFSFEQENYTSVASLYRALKLKAQGVVKGKCFKCDKNTYVKCECGNYTCESHEMQSCDCKNC